MKFLSLITTLTYSLAVFSNSGSNTKEVTWKWTDNTRAIDAKIREICGSPTPKEFDSANENCQSEHFPEV
ncbi:MAG: hypothetical protein CME61_06845, partial [Halobacteriovoraceae bacterium]|nr:hypothetical protein [Halobacteriovoraceae bacterium]